MIPLRGRRCGLPEVVAGERAKRGGTRRLVLVSASSAAAATNRDAELNTSSHHGNGEIVHVKEGRRNANKTRGCLLRAGAERSLEAS